VGHFEKVGVRSRIRKFWKGWSWTFYHRLRNPDENMQRCQLHVFADASATGYGAMCYLRAVDQKSSVTCTLATSKARNVHTALGIDYCSDGSATGRPCDKRIEPRPWTHYIMDRLICCPSKCTQ